MNEQALLVVVIDTGADVGHTIALLAGKAEGVLTLNRAERAHVENLVCGDRFAPARGLQHVAVALAKGVVHFGHHGTQLALRRVVKAIPEAHRLEAKAQHPRVGLQPDVCARVGNTL